jgi:hypothetical protein
MTRKFAILWDFCYAITGSYVGFKKDPSGESDLVTPMYVPLNGLFTKMYPVSIPQSSIMTITLPASNIPGAVTEIVVIKEDTKGRSLVGEQLRGLLDKKLSDLRQQIEDNKLELMKDKHRAQEKVQESRKQIQEDSQLTQRRDRRDPFGVDGRFGEPFANDFRRNSFDEEFR